MEGISLQESEELKVTSDDPNERKLARRQRIQRRLEAAKRQHIVDEEEVQEEKGKSLLDEQVENSADQLEKLLLEGRELVTNVRVASDSREVKHREELAIAREKRTKVVEEEAEKSLKKFEEIDQKWSSILVSKDPLDIHHAMEEQKVKCRELIEQKNMLIEELRHELKQADIRFHEDQKKQKDDVVTLAERIDNQVNVMRRAYRQELRLIEQAIEIERKQLLDTNKKRWDPLYSERETEEIENMEKKFQQVAEFEEEMRKIDLEHEENYRESKIKLETDIQILQQELEQIKASCLLNSEKLDYNYLILKKRVDENIILKCQQKRQINKLQGMVNSLKKNIAEIENITKNESDHLRNDIIKLHDKLMKLDERTDYLSQINDTKYHQLWDMNQEKATKLLQKILAADKFIHEELLGLTWVPPDFPKMKKTDLPSYQAAVKAVDNLTEKKVECTGADVQKKIHSDIDTSDDNTNMLLKHILQKIADESQFLIEECLNKLLFLHRKDGKTLVKLDNVFSALGVTKKEDIMLMKEFFLPYTFCPICSDLKADEKKSEEVTSEKIDTMYSQESGETAVPPSESVASVQSMDEQISEESHPGSSQHVETQPTPEQKPMKSSPPTVEEMALQKDRTMDCVLTHHVKINPVYVLKALREFISDFSSKRQQTYVNLESRLSRKRDTVSRLLSTDDVTAYWKKFENIFSPKAIQLWDCLYTGLQKYHCVLKERHRLNVETQQLQHQNTELRRLLRGYILSPGNERMTPISKKILPPVFHHIKKTEAINSQE
ncbi:dynein regulatory complex protein 1 [Schistocerca serialis cubense]|uniref:dynein regulatory complex protein 1 n=1 Tax=Schistocerca serialis cubense TaxID=2023355 RepID=UPI00214F5241|nr:dynein regulatory complex protein 1 [Schistocerca serialis cubense]